MLKGLVTFLKAEQIQRIIVRLAKDINRDYSESGQTVLICPLRGSIFFLSDLIRHLKFPVEVDFILLEVQGEQSFRIKKDISLDLKGKNVLIVEEIIDSGLALHFLQERIKLAHPANLKTVALLDKSSQRKTFFLDFLTV